MGGLRIFGPNGCDQSHTLMVIPPTGRELQGVVGNGAREAVKPPLVEEFTILGLGQGWKEG